MDTTMTQAGILILEYSKPSKMLVRVGNDEDAVEVEINLDESSNQFSIAIRDNPHSNESDEYLWEGVFDINDLKLNKG